MNCKIMRRMWITHGFMSLDGTESEESHSEWVEQECGTPIFNGNKDVCSSCLSGWEHPENKMLDTDANKKLLKNAKS